MIEGKTTDSLVISSEEVPLPETVDGVLKVLKRILSKPFVQSVTLRTGEPINVVWYRDLTDSLSTEDPEESPDDALHRIDLEEFSSTKTPKESLLDAIFFLNQRGMHATHLFVGEVGFFKDWQGLPSVVAIPTMHGTDHRNYLGLILVEVPSLERDVVVLVGAPSRDATLGETTKALKIIT